MRTHPFVSEQSPDPEPDTSSWRDRALCRGMPLDFFFPNHGGKIPKKTYETCAACPVRAECRAEADKPAWPEDQPFGPWGIWGGVSADERERDRLAAEPANERQRSRRANVGGRQATKFLAEMALDDLHAA